MFNARHVFLWGVLKEEIYMCQPKGFEEGELKEMVWRMLRTLYGLKQSAMEWYEQVRAVMEELGFARCAVNHTVFLYDHSHKEGTLSSRIIRLIAWHVDDGMGASNSQLFLLWVKGKIAHCFGIKDLGPIARFLGMQFECDHSTCQL